MTQIKNPEYQVTLSASERPLEFTAYRSKAEAKRQIHSAHNPCLVRIAGQDANGVEHVWYDTYPAGHPVARRATVYYNDEGGTVHATIEIIERCTLTASGMRWRQVA